MKLWIFRLLFVTIGGTNILLMINFGYLTFEAVVITGLLWIYTREGFVAAREANEIVAKQDELREQLADLQNELDAAKSVIESQ